MPTLRDRIRSLEGAITFGLDNGKKNVVADLDVLFEIIMQRQKLLHDLEMITGQVFTYFEGFVMAGQIPMQAIQEARATLRRCSPDFFENSLASANKAD